VIGPEAGCCEVVRQKEAVMRTRVALPTIGVVLLFAGVGIDRYLLPPAVIAPPEAAPPSRFLAAFDGWGLVERHLVGVELAPISQLTDRGVRVNHGVHTWTFSALCNHPNPGGLAEIQAAMKAIGSDIAARVAAEGGTTVCTDLGWGERPGEWVYKVGDHRGVVTVAIINLNRPTRTDLPANLVVVVQLAEF
jgi:hypothetical protein